MQRVLFTVGLLLLCCIAAQAKARVQGYSTYPAKISTAGILSTDKAQKVYTSVTVTVKIAGTSTMATLFSDNAGTPKGNPFTSGASDGFWFFYVANGRYDITFSGSGITTHTVSDVVVFDRVDD